MREQFEAIYRSGGWSGKGSGPGSDPKAAEPFLLMLSQTLQKLKPKRVLDLGCGDWQLFRNFSWPCAYHGIDVVRPVIAENQRLYQRDQITFHAICATEAYMEGFDLIIAKDLFQHLPFGAISKIVRSIRKPFLFCGDMPTNRKGDIEPGEYRPIDLRGEPWNLKAAETIFFKSAPREKLACLFTSYEL